MPTIRRRPPLNIVHLAHTAAAIHRRRSPSRQAVTAPPRAHGGPRREERRLRGGRARGVHYEQRARRGVRPRLRGRYGLRHEARQLAMGACTCRGRRRGDRWRAGGYRGGGGGGKRGHERDGDGGVAGRGVRGLRGVEDVAQLLVEGLHLPLRWRGHDAALCMTVAVAVAVGGGFGGGDGAVERRGRGGRCGGARVPVWRPDGRGEVVAGDDGYPARTGGCVRVEPCRQTHACM